MFDASTLFCIYALVGILLTTVTTFYSANSPTGPPDESGCFLLGILIGLVWPLIVVGAVLFVFGRGSFLVCSQAWKSKACNAS
jgi:hypothetical protein